MQSSEFEPFMHWRCDECGREIDMPQHGWVEWRERDGSVTDFRIVHHIDWSPREDGQGCYGASIAGNMLLENLLGDDGLAWLLGLLAKVNVAQDQFAELVRRLHIPGYEEARNHRVDPHSYETNGVREYTQAGIIAKLRLPAAL